MDVLKPDIVVVEGIRFRINPGNHRTIGGTSSEQCEDRYYDQYDDTPACEVLSDSEENIEELDGGRYKISFHVPKSYFPYIIGSKGATKKRLEAETHSKISIPKLGHDGDIVITATTKKNVASAHRRIRMMVLSSRKRRSLTHFLSIPLCKPGLIDGFLQFKNEVLENCAKDGITEDLFQTPERLHLTIAVLALYDDSERQEAARALEECDETVIRPLLNGMKLEVEMSGIEIMNDDPSDVKVLYGKVKTTNDEQPLQELVDGINSFFSQKDLLMREKEAVKIHCTLLNTHFLQREEEESLTKSSQIMSFDATNILKMYKDYYFGKDVISTVELSIFGSSDKNKYYKATSVVILP